MARTSSPSSSSQLTRRARMRRRLDARTSSVLSMRTGCGTVDATSSFSRWCSTHSCIVAALKDNGHFGPRSGIGPQRCPDGPSMVDRTNRVGCLMKEQAMVTSGGDHLPWRGHDHGAFFPAAWLRWSIADTFLDRHGRRIYLIPSWRLIEVGREAGDVYGRRSGLSG